MSAFKYKAKREIRRRRLRRYLTGLAWGTGLGLLAFLIAWSWFRDNLGGYAAEVVQQQAEKSLNGRLTFDKLYIDRFGRSIFSGVEVYGEDGEKLISAPTAVASINPLTLAGPNFGQRSVSLSLFNPELTVVRRADGSINLGELAKPSEAKRQAWGYTIHVRGGTVHYTDYALLRQGYPRWTKLRGLTKDLFAELGYDPHRYESGDTELPSEVAEAPFSETIGISGDFGFSALRGDTSIDVDMQRPQKGEVMLKAKIGDQGRDFSIQVGFKDTELASLREYIHSLYPKLQLASSGSEASTEPLLAGLMRTGTVNIEKPEGKPVQVQVDTHIDRGRFNSSLLPAMAFPRFQVNYDGPASELTMDYEVHSAGVVAVGTTGFGFKDDQIGGDLRINVTDFAEMYKRLGLRGPHLSGQLTGEIALGGRLGLPDVSGTLRGGNLAAGGARLGNLVAVGEYKEGSVKFEKLRLSGGQLPLNASGTYSPNEGNGSAKLTAGPVQVAAVIALAKALRIQLPTAFKGASGVVDAKADLKFAKKKVSGTAALSSKSIALAGQSFTNASAKVKIEHSLLRVQELRADLVTKANFNQLGFKSSGPLQLALRATGTAQLPPAKSPSLNLTGTLGTLNLTPEQALVNLELTGPIKSPNYKAQLKTTGDSPIMVNARGKLATPMPMNATIDWGTQRASFDGTLNLPAQSVNGKLIANDIDLARLMPDGPARGTLSLNATLSGPFRKLTASGTLNSPRIAGKVADRDLALTDLSLGFDVAAGTALTINKGAFGFAGSSFNLDGTLGKNGQQLTLSSEAFDLAQALAGTVGKTEIDVQAEGPLRAVFSGTLKQPQLEVTYASGPGSIEQRAFENLELALSANMHEVNLQRLALTGLGGTASASGTVALAGDSFSNLHVQSYNLSADADSLRAELIAPLLGVPMLADASGSLSGDLTLTGNAKDWDVSGGVSLENGSLQGIAFDDAHLGIVTQDKAITLTDAYLVKGDSRIVATGTIGPGKKQFDIHVGAETFDLALLRPFLPRQYSELGGRATFELVLRPPDESGYPRVELELHDVGGVEFAGVRFSEMEVAASLREGVLLINTARLVSHGSTLRASGRMSPTLFAGTGLPRGRGRSAKQQPLNLRLQTENFSLGVLGALLPPAARAQLPGGTLTADLTVTGRLSSPQLRGTIDFNLNKLPAALPVQIASLSGRVAFGDNNTFTIQNVQIGGAGQQALQQIAIDGGGRFSLNPPSLTAGAINVNLAPNGHFVHVEDVFGYTGGVGGTITITPPARGGKGFVIGGQLVINEAQGEGTLALHMPSSSGGGGPSSFRFDNFQVVVSPGTTVAFSIPLVQVTASVQGALSINGRPGLTGRVGSGTEQPLSILGRLDIPHGNLLVYRHEVRLTGDENYISFTGQPGDIFPHLTADATLVLRNVLRGNETIEYAANEQAVRPGEDDLTIFFSFNNMLLGPGTRMEDMRITSEPPMPEDQLRSYLYGDFYDVLAGRSELGDFAQRELLAYSTSFISRQIERGLGLEAFSFGGSGADDNPFYISAEKELSPDVYLSYFRTFYSQTQQKEDITLRYRFFHTRYAGTSQNASVAVSFVRTDLQQDAVEVELQYNVKFGGKKRDKKAVAAAKEAADAGRPLSPEQQRLIRNPDAPPAKPTEAKPKAEAAKEVKQADVVTGGEGSTENVATDVVIAPPPKPVKQP